MASLRAAVAVVSVALAAPGAASAATLTVEPKRSCYRETQRVFLRAQGYTPNGLVEFTRDGRRIAEPLQADGSGQIQGDLKLPGLLRGQPPLTYVATDLTNPAVSAQVTLTTTATDVLVGPKTGPPNRRLRIRARGFKGGRTLWAHVRRARRGATRTRAVRIGRVRGPCWKVRARKRLFRRSTAPGRYRVQFDTFRRYKPRRKVEYDELIVTISRARRP